MSIISWSIFIEEFCYIFIIQSSIMILGSLTERITCTTIKHKRQETQRIFLRETIKEKTPQLPSEIELAPKVKPKNIKMISWQQ